MEKLTWSACALQQQLRVTGLNCRDLSANRCFVCEVDIFVSDGVMEYTLNIDKYIVVFTLGGADNEVLEQPHWQRIEWPS